MNEYRLGNFIRGYYSGTFPLQKEAWSCLSNRFILDNPEEYGRHVVMEMVTEGENRECESGFAEINDLDEDYVLNATSPCL